MYTPFYHLDSKPFENNPDPSFLWLGEKHKESLAALHYGILNTSGFLLLTGDAGTGKTTLINALIRSLEKDVEWAVIADPRLERIDFYNTIARGFGIEKQFTSKVQFLIQFSHFLHKADDENKKVVLVVDDCHKLSQEMFEELRLLSNIEKAETKLINMYFVGQRELNDMLAEPKNRTVRQRLTLESELTPLSVNETEDYIRHRLKVAGRVERLFAAKAIQMIHGFSEGVPRRINAICEHALVAGCVQGRQVIDRKSIEECIQELNLPVNPEQEDLESFSGGQDALDSFKKKFVPDTAKASSTVSGFNIEEDEKRGSWLKYGLGLLGVLVASTYFWFSWQQPLEDDRINTVGAEQVPEVHDVSPASASPAVAMFEENQSEMNEKQTAELKTAILAEVHRSTEKSVTERVLDLDRQRELPPAEQTIPEAELEQVARSGETEIDKEIAASTETIAEDVVVLKKGPGKIIITSGEEELAAELVAVQGDQIERLTPRKMILGLQPNSLKLTVTANREFQAFVKKLKKYPRAMVLVKGFVSSQSNSPQNIELSRQRAMSVQKLLVEKGIDAEQIEVIGLGNQEPIGDNITWEGRRKNRRVEIIVIRDGL